MSEEPTRDWRSMRAYYNGQVIALITCSGRGNRGPDDKGPVHFLPANVPNHLLGEAMQDCLSKSRFLLSAEWKVFFSKEEIARKDIWENDVLVSGLHAKNFKELKKKLMYVEIDKSDMNYETKVKSDQRNIVLTPTKNVLGQSWDAVDGGRASKEIIHNYPCPPAELGALLREAFKRCEGVGRDEIEFPEPLPD